MPNLILYFTPAFFFLIFCSSTPSFSQYNFYKFTAGAGYGAVFTYPDEKIFVSLAPYGSLNYNVTPFTTLGLEIQKGKLTRGDTFFGFINKYTTITLNGKIHAGRFMSRRDFKNFALNSIRGIYVGAGIGIISNKGEQYNNGTQLLEGKDIVFPFNIGSDFYFPNRWGYSRFILNINLQNSFFLKDGLDRGFNIKNNYKNFYTYSSVGIKYNFGPLGLYQKR